MNDEDKAEDHYKYPPEQVSKEVLRAVGAEAFGHVIAPEYVDAPDSIFTYNGMPIGFSSRAIPAEPVRIEDMSDPDIEYILDSLSAAGVYCDYFGQNAIPYLDDSGRQRVKLIDMQVDEAKLHQKMTSS